MWNRPCFGKDSKEWGQALVAIVVPKEGLNQQVLIDSMNQHLKQTLANHKLPKAYLFVEELPILENGKRDNVRIRNCSIQLMCDSIMWVKKYFKFTANH